MSDHLQIIDSCRRPEATHPKPSPKRVLSNRIHHPATIARRVVARLKRHHRANRSLVAGMVWALRQRYAHHILAALSTVGPDILPELIVTLRHPDGRARMAAAFTLGYMGPDALPAVPVLVI